MIEAFLCTRSCTSKAAKINNYKILIFVITMPRAAG